MRVNRFAEISSQNIRYKSLQLYGGSKGQLDALFYNQVKPYRGVTMIKE